MKSVTMGLTPKNVFLWWLLERYSFTLTKQVMNDMRDTTLIASCVSKHPDATNVRVEEASRGAKEVHFNLPDDAKGSSHYFTVHPEWVPNQVIIELEENALLFLTMNGDQAGILFTQLEDEVDEFARAQKCVIFSMPNADHLEHEVFAKLGLEPVPYKKWSRRWNTLLKTLGIRQTPWHQRAVVKLGKCSEMQLLGPVVFAQ